MSTQTAQPLIWLALVRIRLASPGGSVPFGTAADVALMRFTKSCRILEFLKSIRASTPISLVVLVICPSVEQIVDRRTRLRRPTGTEGNVAAVLPLRLTMRPGSDNTSRGRGRP